VTVSQGRSAAGADPWERVRATVTAYRRFAIDKARRYRLMFSLSTSPTDHPVGTALQAWTGTADAYLSEVVPGRRAEARDLGVHLWTAPPARSARTAAYPAEFRRRQ
jgi:AcrR family transcriptional regulator